MSAIYTKKELDNILRSLNLDVIQKNLKNAEFRRNLLATLSHAVERWDASVIFLRGAALTVVGNQHAALGTALHNANFCLRDTMKDGQETKKDFEFNVHTTRRALVQMPPHDKRFWEAVAVVVVLKAAELVKSGQNVVCPELFVADSPVAFALQTFLSSQNGRGGVEVTKDAERLESRSANDIAFLQPGQFWNSVTKSSNVTLVRTRLFSADSNFGEENINSFYMIYRYSSISGQIVKSFLVIKQRPNNAYRYWFTHVYRGQTDGASINKIIHSRTLRVARGAVLCYENNIYLCGYATSRELDNRADLSRGDSATVRGIKVLSFEASGDRSMFSGLFLSQSSSWKAIVGRCVLIHLGFQRHERDPHVTEKELHPTVLSKIDDIKPDLKETEERIENFYKKTGLPDDTKFKLSVNTGRPFEDAVHMNDTDWLDSIAEYVKINCDLAPQIALARGMIATLPLALQLRFNEQDI